MAPQSNNSTLEIESGEEIYNRPRQHGSFTRSMKGGFDDFDPSLSPTSAELIHQTGDTRDASPVSASTSTSFPLRRRGLCLLLFLVLAGVCIQLGQTSFEKLSQSIVEGFFWPDTLGGGQQQDHKIYVQHGGEMEEWSIIDGSGEPEESQPIIESIGETTTEEMSQRVVRHPRTTCFMGFEYYNDPNAPSCQYLLAKNKMNTLNVHTMMNSIPITATEMQDEEGGNSKKHKHRKNSNDYFVDIHSSETDDCKFIDPSYQALPAAPSTCNDVHALGFERLDFLTAGGTRYAFAVRSSHRNSDNPPDEDGNVEEDEGEEEEDATVLKTNKVQRSYSAHWHDQNRREALVSERAGRAPSSHDANVLQILHYCAFSSLVPYATDGDLTTYIKEKRKDGQFLYATQQFLLGMQAARGLYQAHLYRGGRATNVHADVNPNQFLLFEPPPRTTTKDVGMATSETAEDLTAASIDDAMVEANVPILQINDFNRGTFLTQSTTTDRNNETCPFTVCDETDSHVHHKQSLYGAPEEYMECEGMTDKMDVYSLGHVLYYILSDGRTPYRGIQRDEGVQLILGGTTPALPKPVEYADDYGEEAVLHVEERARHPAYRALVEVMNECWTLTAEDRPSSLQVVRLMEEKWREMNEQCVFFALHHDFSC
mmetsp:Transcript_18423/g.38697  ORF Transcript_18423/g.38697 Transcript_18423/m.38697 type:complete len:654 (+) Transcript_18423:265-2226(+)